MKIPFWFRPSLFNTLNYAEQTSLGSSGADTGVLSGSSSAATVETQTSAPAGDQGEATQGESSNATTEQSTEAAAPFKIPDTDDDVKGHPQEQNIVQLRQHARGLEKDLTGVKGEYEPWKPHIEKIGDPGTLEAYQKTFAGIHQPVIDPSTQQPTGQYTSKGALQTLEAEYPGVVDEMFQDMLGMRVEINGQQDTLNRHLMRSWGLNPDRMSEYKEIDKRVPGIVSDAELQAIPEAYREAYKQLPQSLRGVWSELDDQEKQYHLNTSKAALDAAEIRQQIESDKQTTAQAQEKKFEAQVQQKQEESLVTQTKTLYGKIAESLAAQVKFSEADPDLNESQQTGIMAKLYCLIDPAASFLLEGELKKAGIALDFPDATWQQTIEAFSEKDSKAVLHQEQGQVALARQTRTEANNLLARISSRLNSVGLTLAQRAAGHVVTKSATNTGLNGTRQAPNGNGFPQGNSNPYLGNPHDIGTAEYRVWNRDMDRQLGVGAAR